MHKYGGHLQKMGVKLLPQALPMVISESTEFADDDAAISTNVQYQLLLDDQAIPLNGLIGRQVRLRSVGEIRCMHCGRVSKKSFSQGYCYPCFRSLARCDQCIVSPEKCHFDQGTCREPDWGTDFCMQDHYVYLANSSGIKVGVTRGTQIPTRWIDQGAVAARPLYRVATRKLAGLLEVICKQHVADKTNWRAMLKGSPAPVNLLSAAEALTAAAKTEVDALIDSVGLQAVQSCGDAQDAEIHYPVKKYPEKVVSFNFDKTPVVEGILWGIKGQYLILDTGVINIRKFGGYNIEFSHDA